MEESVRSIGPSPFITRHSVLRNGREHHVLSSRNHRKRLIEAELEKAALRGKGIFHGLWAPAKLNWWIGTIFALFGNFFYLSK